MSAATTAVPSIFEYPDFASYLRSSLEALRPAGAKFSLRNVARRVRRSPSLLAMVARGDRRAQPELAVEICKVFGLSSGEAEFAEALVEYEHARTVVAKSKAAERLRLLKPRHGDLILDLDAFALISSWHHYAILEMSCMVRFVEDPEWIAKALGPTISATMAAESLELLARLGLLRRDGAGRLTKSVSRVGTPKGIPSAAVRSFHKQILMRAHQAIDRQEIKDRLVTSATVAIPSSIVPEVQARIVQFRDELLSFIHEQDLEADTVYQVSMQFFRAMAEPPPAAGVAVVPEGAVMTRPKRGARARPAKASDDGDD